MCSQHYIPRRDGGFWLVDASGPVVQVRRSVNLVIDPQTNMPFMEASLAQQFEDVMIHGRKPSQFNFSNRGPWEHDEAWWARQFSPDGWQQWIDSLWRVPT